MTDSPVSAGPPTTEEEFRDRLVALIRAAQEEDVEVEGGYADRDGSDGLADVGVEVYEVVGPDADGEA